jgi:hypothetical protein
VVTPLRVIYSDTLVRETKKQNDRQEGWKCGVDRLTDGLKEHQPTDKSAHDLHFNSYAAVCRTDPIVLDGFSSICPMDYFLSNPLEYPKGWRISLILDKFANSPGYI